MAEDIYIEWFYLKGLWEKLEEVARENDFDLDGRLHTFSIGLEFKIK